MYRIHITETKGKFDQFEKKHATATQPVTPVCVTNLSMGSYR